MAADINIAVSKNFHSSRPSRRVVVKQNRAAITAWQENDEATATTENGWSPSIRNQCGTACGRRSAECRLASLSEEIPAPIINDG